MLWVVFVHWWMRDKSDSDGGMERFNVYLTFVAAIWIYILPREKGNNCNFLICVLCTAEFDADVKGGTGE